VATITRFTIVTPGAIKFEGDASIVVAPGAAGDLGALPNHAPLLTTLRAGAVRATTTVQPFPIPPAIRPERTLSPGQWGMIRFLVSEVALFGPLIVPSIFSLGRAVVGPTHAEAQSLSLVVWTTVFLLTSSGTVLVVGRRLGRADEGGWTPVERKEGRMEVKQAMRRRLKQGLGE